MTSDTDKKPDPIPARTEEEEMRLHAEWVEQLRRDNPRGYERGTLDTDARGNWRRY